MAQEKDCWSSPTKVMGFQLEMRLNILQRTLDRDVDIEEEMGSNLKGLTEKLTQYQMTM